MLRALLQHNILQKKCSGHYSAPQFWNSSLVCSVVQGGKQVQSGKSTLVMIKLNSKMKNKKQKKQSSP